MQKNFTLNLGLDQSPQEAIKFYTSAVPNFKMITKSYSPNCDEEGLSDMQLYLAGHVLTIDFELGEYPFVAINAGSGYQFNPLISFMLNFDPIMQRMNHRMISGTNASMSA